MQSYRKSEIDLEQIEGSDDIKSDDDQNNQQIENVRRGRRRPKIPLQWSRVISLYHDNLTKLRTFDLASDIILDKALEKEIVSRRNAWTMYFRPKDFMNDHPGLVVAKYKLTEAKLLKLGKQVSGI